MSRSFAFARLGAPAAVAAAAFTLPAVASATAVLDYRCQYPLAGAGAATIEVDAYLPEVVFPGEPLLPSEVSVAAIQTPLKAASLQRNYPGIVSISGTGRASFTVEQSGGEDLSFFVPLNVEPSLPAAASTPLYGSGQTPVLFPERGNAVFSVGAVSFNLRALDADGEPIRYAGPVIDGETWPDSDGDPETFDVRCTLDPAGQSTEVGYTIVDNLVIEACFFGGDFCPTPGVARHVRLLNVDETSAELVWTRATTNGFGDYGAFEYVVEVNGQTLRTRGKRLTLSGLSAETTYSGTITTTYTGSTGQSAPVPFTFTTALDPTLDRTAPSKPTAVDLARADLGDTFVNLKWGESFDEPGGSGVEEYLVEYLGTTVSVPAGTTSTRIEGLDGPLAQVSITAVDAAGNRSESLVLTPWTTIPESWRPTAPTEGDFVDSDFTSTSINLRWGPSTPQADGPPIKAYVVRYDGREVTVPAGTTSKLVTGLLPDSEYFVDIVAVDEDGLESQPLQYLLITRVAPPSAQFSYGLAGSASLKTLTRGNLPLKGGIDAELTLETGAFSADLTLADTQGRLTALGFLPVTAKIGFVPSGKTTGTLLDGVLSSTSKVRIKVKEVKLFGAIPLAGGNNCQTRQLSDINLTSTDEFKPLQGGNLAGTFAISDLNGCGVLNGLVSPLTAGGGNTINLKLTPKPTA